MEKGWDFQYFVLKKKQLQEELEKTTDLEKKEQIEEDIEICDNLMLTLLCSEGETIYSKITTKSFVEEIYQQGFSYPIPSAEEKRIEKITLSLAKLPKLKIEQDNTHITASDSIELVGDFLKDKFGDKHYQLFKKVFVDHQNYVLLDREDELSNVTYLDGEIFVRIAESKNMEMLSSIAHEAGHVYRIANSNYKTLIHSYGEYESFFYEFNLLLWLIENGIYQQEATNQFLRQFDILEKVSYMRYLIQHYQLNNIKEPAEFTKTINELHIKKGLHVRKNQDLFNIYSTAMYMDLQTYLNSFMATLNNINDVSKYEEMVKCIKPGNDDTIKAKVLNKNKGEYDSYLKYRNILRNSK